MPLNKSCSVKAYRANIAESIRAGKDPKQAVAIAHQTLRDSCKAAGMATPRTDGADSGLQVNRYDEGEFSSPTRTASGYLKCDAKITRVGVFKYRQADGSVRSELRLPDEVFNEDALGSFQDVPLTNNHPREKLSTKNTRKFQIGNVNSVRPADKFVAAKVLITDEDAIADAEAGKTQLSCGYACDLDFVSGVTDGIPGIPDGQRYDAIQRNIVGNHVAIVDKGRAGDASLHLDGDDAVMLVDTNPEPAPKPREPGDRPMAKTVKIDSVDYEMTEQAAQAVGKLAARMDQLEESTTELKTQVATEKARADKAEEDLEAEKKARKEDSSDEAVQKAVRARVALETSAAEILKTDDEKEELKLDEKSDAELRRAVVLKVSPGAEEKLDAGDEVYLAARFDAAVEAFKAKPKETKKPNASNAIRGATGVDKNDSRSPRERMQDVNIRLGREPIRPSTPE